MTQVTFKGEPVATLGIAAAIGAKSLVFTLMAGDLSEMKPDNLKGKSHS